MASRRTYTPEDWQADQKAAQGARKGRRIIAAADLRKNLHAAMARSLRATKRASKGSVQA